MTRPESRVVLQVIETGGAGGAETITVGLSAALVERGWKVEVCGPGGGWMEQAVRDARIGFCPVDFPRLGLAEASLQIRRRVRRTGAHVVHAHLLGSGTYAAMGCLGLGVPVLTSLHGTPDVEAGYRCLGQRLSWLSRSPNAVVCVSRALRQAVADRVGLSEDTIQVVYNGIDAVGPADQSPPRPLEVPFRLMAVGNLRPAKDYPTLLRTLAILRARGVPVELAIAGASEGGEIEALIALRDRLGLGDVVRFVGFVEDVPGFLATGHLLVSSSSSEGFSLVLVEALQRGIPVVATRSGGPEEILDGGRFGCLAPREDPAGLADAIQCTFDEWEVARARSLAGRTAMSERFSLARMVEGYEGLYRKMANCALLPLSRSGAWADHPGNGARTAGSVAAEDRRVATRAGPQTDGHGGG